jgi:hypothetical protein
VRPTPQDDDAPTGLPAADGTADDAPQDTETDAFEDEASTEQPEEIGLDAETGIDEPLDADLVLDDSDEGRALLEGTEAAEDLPGSDGSDELAAGEEYGWTEGSEPDASALGDLGDGLPSDDGQRFTEDEGEEGFDDGLAELGLFSLRPLDRSPHDDEGLEGEGESGASTSSTQQRQATGPAEQPARLPRSRVQVEVVHHPGHPLSLLIAAGATGFGWDDGLLVASPGDPVVRRRSASAGHGVARGMAAMVAPWGHELVVSTPEKLLRSADGGVSLHEVTGFAAEQPPTCLALVRRLDGGLRLLAAAPDGGLLASDDAGASFVELGAERVVRLASDGHTGLAALCRAPDGNALLALTHDAGTSMELLTAPSQEPERIIDLQLSAGAVAVAQRLRAPHLLIAHDGDFGSERRTTN